MGEKNLKNTQKPFLDELFEDNPPNYPPNEPAPGTYEDPFYTSQSCRLSGNDKKKYGEA